MRTHRCPSLQMVSQSLWGRDQAFDMIGVWKSGVFLRAISHWGLVVANTFSPPFDGNFTYPTHGNHAPRQIDFVLVDKSLVVGSVCHPFTWLGRNISDHRPIIFACHGEPGVWCSFYRGPAFKPHHWRWSPDFKGGYNQSIRRRFGYPSGYPSATNAAPALSLQRPDPRLAIRLYSDGSYIRDDINLAGWGFTALSPSSSADETTLFDQMAASRRIRLTLTSLGLGRIPRALGSSQES